MKMTYYFKVRSFVLAAAVSMGLSFVSPALAFTSWIVGSNGERLIKLGPLSENFANGINDAGQVVGNFRAPAGNHAFITGPNGVGMTDLNSLVALPDGSVLISATGINNLGQILAISNAIPEPAAYALMLAGLGLVGFMARRMKSDRLSG